MNTGNIYKMIACIAMVLVLASCSNNLDEKFEPLSMRRTLEVTIDGSTVTRLDLPASVSGTSVQVKSNRRWAIEIIGCEGGWCKVNLTNHRGDGTFNITLEDNGLEPRECHVIVYTVDSKETQKFDIDVVQQPVSEDVALPVVGIPYLSGEVGQTSVTLCFEYKSLYYSILEVGVEYRRNNDGNWTKAKTSVIENEMIATVDISGLSPGTVYIARGYVEYNVKGDMKTQISADFFKFSTSGETPGSFDNPPPPIP